MPLRNSNRCLHSAPAARKLQDAASDPTEGLKRRKDEGRIVSTEDDASKRLLELIYRGMFTWLRGYAFMSCMSGPYRSCNDQTLPSLHARRHKRTACQGLAGEHTGAGEEEGGEGEAINEPPHIFRKAHLFEFSCYSLCF